MILLIIVIIVTLILLLGIGYFYYYSEKTLKHVLLEIKYEFIYNLLGCRALLEDILLRNKNNRVIASVSKGKIAVVTGGARGIGVEVVKKLLECDVHVIIGCRNPDAGEALLKHLGEKRVKKLKAEVIKLDLASIQSVKSFAKKVKERHQKINILINNAGKMFGPYIETEDGFESQFQTNYLGHFLLTHLLYPELVAAGNENDKSRIVNVSSCANVVGNINFEDINFSKQYIGSEAYAQSKLAQIMFTHYLADHVIRNAPVAVYSVHPGIVNTELFNGTLLKKFAPSWWLKLIFKTPKQGAISVLYASLSQNLENKSGSYISNCYIMPASHLAYNTFLQKKLFDYSKFVLNIEEFGV